MFTSRRERRLWIIALCLVAAIYATLGLAASLARAVPDTPLAQGIGISVFVLGLVLVAVTVLTQGLRYTPAGHEIGLALGFFVVYLLLFLRLTLPERSHLMEYSVVAVVVHEALTERYRSQRRLWRTAILAVAITAGVGILDELIQLFLPQRVFDPTDIVFNALAAVMAVVALTFLGWVRRRRQTQGRPSKQDNP